MHNGLIIEDHQVIALDLKYTISKNYTVIDIISNSDEASRCTRSDIDFLLMDTDIQGSFAELRKIVDTLNCREAKIILLSSQPANLIDPSFTYSDIVYKPFQENLLFSAIERSLSHTA